MTSMDSKSDDVGKSVKARRKDGPPHVRYSGLRAINSSHNAITHARECQVFSFHFGSIVG